MTGNYGLPSILIMIVLGTGVIELPYVRAYQWDIEETLYIWCTGVIDPVIYSAVC
jgi:hypothetical protein